jgi:glycosyltransferase involved in cell wall biosynthesis
VVSIVVPAHNEARVIGRLLGQLVSPGGQDDLDVIVIANGCTDDTAEVAAAFGPPVRVVALPVASKRQALDAGDRVAVGFPRIYVDADVELGAEDIRALDAALRRPGVLAAAPERALDMAGRPWPVRWYYDVWTRLPEVRSGLFGRGVIGVSEQGFERIASLPPVIGDDLAASLAFRSAERAIVPTAKAVIHPPRTTADLLRRRIRAAIAVTQIEHTAGGTDASARTSPSDLARIARADPWMVPRVAVFLAVAVLARLGARRAVRRNGYSTWLRDESSRDA